MSSCEVTSHSVIGWVMRTFLLGVFTFLSVNVTLHGQCQTCCNGSKPKTLVFTYVGGSCSDTKTCQADGKWACTGSGSAGATTVYITASKNADGSGGTYFAGTVNLNADFTANSASGGSSTFPSNTYFNIYSSLGGTLLQRLQIHTSCSTPLVAGDQFGALFLKKIILADNTNCDAPTPPGPPEECPTPVITINNSTPTTVGQLCKGDQIIFKTTDTGYPCIAYSWNFGANATPATATGIGPHTVTYSAAGSATVSLTIDNDCEGGVGTTVCPPPPPPPIGGDCCESFSGKPKSIKLKYVGGSCSASTTSQASGKFSCADSGGGANASSVYIVANEKIDGTGVTFFSGNVNLNASFTATAPGSSLPSNTFVLIYSSQGGSLLQKLQIHTSCSAPLVPGEQFGALLLESATWSNGATCDVNNSGSSGGSGGADCCDSNSGKPKSLTIQYNGLGCSASSTSQSTDKYSCSDSGGGPNNAQSVYIIASDQATGGVIFFSGNVSLGGIFTATATSSTLPTNTYFRIFSSQGGTLLQSVKIHTSCSAPIVPGDQFGSLKLLAATWASGATCGTVTPPGPNCLDCKKTVTVNITIEDCQPLGSIGDRVWNDLNANGIQDPNEPGVPDVVVLLKDCNNNVIGGTTTNANGIYNFPDLPAGCYRVGIALPTGFEVSPQNAGTNDAADSDIDPVMFMTGNITLDPGENDPTNDAGIYEPTSLPGSIGDRVFNDLNQNGIQDPNEPGVSGVVVLLKDCNNNVIGGTTTDANGIYNFPNLPAGCYRVGFVVQGGYTVSPQNVGNNDAVDSDIDPVMFMTGNITLAPGENDPTNDAGIYQTPPQPAALGDFVWNDLNQNGLQDSGEQGVANVTVRLYRCDGTFLSSTTTNNVGFYQFTNLTPNTQYFVEFTNLPAGFQFTARNAQNNTQDNIDSDANPSDGRTDCTFLSPGEVDNTLDAGVYQSTPILGSLGDFVWNDLDNDGFQDANEPGIGGVTVRLKNCNNAVLAVTTTNNAGFYTFNNLAAGCYRVEVVLPTGFVFSPANFGGDDTKDSDIDPNTAMTGNINLAQGQNDPTNDAGIYQPTQPPGSIGDKVWNDLDQDGQQDPNEPGVPGVTVRLLDCNGNVIATTTTNANGIYTFNNLPAGNYIVEFVLPAGYQRSPKDAGNDALDSDADQNTGRTDCFPLAPGQNDPTRDAGIYQPTQPPGSIGDKVWNDQNQNGLQDPSEPGVPGVTVRLLDCNGNVIATTTTNANGIYTFNNLPGGNYIVEFVLPAGYQRSQKDAGNDSLDSDADPNTGRTDCFPLAPGQNDPTRDAGIYQPTQEPACVGDFVWKDMNSNGIQDAGEPGVQGVIVKLFTCTGTYIGQFTTNANGYYKFINLTPGSYFLQFSNLPAGFMFTTKDAGANDAVDSDADQTTGNTACFNLTPGQTDLTRDAGLKPIPTTGPATIGDYVWFDTNANGIQDAGEPGIPGVFVILETCTGAFVDFKVTDAQGLYLFTNVAPGQYRVKFANPGTYNGVPIQLTIKDAGNDDSKDSDADWLGFTNCITVNAGETNLTIDAGFKGETPPPVCVINGSVSNIVCSDNGTPNNPADDTYTFTIIVNGTNTGEWGYDIPALGLFMAQYGQPYNLGPFNISAGTLTLLINDHDVADCKTTVTVQPPAPCSSAPCTATAGTLIATQTPVTLQNGSATISAYHGQQPFVPAGYQKIYVLTKGAGLVIQATSNTPSFTVTSTGQYTIHTLVYNPATLNLGIVVPGVTTGFDVNALLIQGGGSICAALDVPGAVITVNPPQVVCDNFTNGGTIGYDETNCVGFDPAPIVSLSLPSGGSGAIEYIWLKSTLGCPDNLNQAIPGATGPTYDPPFINQTTWFIRCARRVGCTQYIESNCIKKEVCTSGGGCNVTIAGGSNSITIAGLNAPNVDVKVFNANWQMVFNCFNNCNNPQIVTSLPAGTYYVDVQMWNANWQPVCNKSQYVTVTNLTGNNGGINLVTPGNDDGEEDSESVVNDRSSENHEMVIPVESLDVRLYPNPANAFVTLDLESMMGQEVQIELLDNLGRKIQRIELDEVTTALHRIELNELKEGYYMVWVKTPGSKPVVKQLIVAKR